MKTQTAGAPSPAVFFCVLDVDSMTTGTTDHVSPEPVFLPLITI